jgi:glycerophosphoryl diester phosphodiesterase
VLVCLHDDTVDRTTDGTGPVEEMGLDELRRLDAGHRFSPDLGRSFPFRDAGVRVPALDEVVEAAEALPVIIEVKSARAGAALRAWFAGRRDRERFLVGGFEHEQVRPAAEALGRRCSTRRDLAPFLLLGKIGVRWPLPAGVEACMVPVRRRLLRIVTRGFVRRCHRLGVGVYVWTVNRPDQMRRLLDLGVDGLISDVPAIARRVVEERAANRAPPPDAQAGAPTSPTGAASG